ncbi:DUF5107 domain-containing protein [Flexivirga caeni]|uniref:DUF5107 domain-containing protein n=1 Tax=Flexivirga caeni TaxID=2294115 RepID=A0A3M9MGJ4_9MICO|nr:DUF5107 domain-containing protein [Flexivirga caeni]RNI24315.1 DUF5107 domain-containing protein [Flexivirga caeni]
MHPIDSAAPTTVRASRLAVIGANLGEQSPLPAYRPVRAMTTTTLDPNAPAAMRERVARGRLATPLPYGVQSDYDRSDAALDLPAVILDNGILRATVLPALGGRVWSLREQRTGRELLLTPDRLRYAGFALTDAWFAGGIEWNLGSTGHATTTCRPMHAAVVDSPCGQALRLWEWERTRDLILVIDLTLAGDRLLASTRVINPDPEPKPLYYWTNIAVPETPHTRVLTPATHAWRTSYSGSLDRVSVPHPDGPADISYPAASAASADYFFDVVAQTGRSITAVEPDGLGFAQTSTGELHGRKLFLWGSARGGRRWQRWLVGDRTYAEIQAGVCTTQLEHDLIDGSAERSWTEAFGAARLDPGVVGAPFTEAAAAAAEAVATAVPVAELEAWHEQWLREFASQSLHERLADGSGWGRVELALRGDSAPAGVDFPEVADNSRLGAAVLAGEQLDEPLLPLISPRWRRAIAHAPDGWWRSYALGVAAHLDGSAAEAAAHYRESIAHRPTAVALRGLAVLSTDVAEAAAFYAQARTLDPHTRGLLTEQVTGLLDAGRPADALAAIDAADSALRAHGRTRLLHARALHALGRDAEAAALLADSGLEVPDLAEGDRVIGELWRAVAPGQPLPAALDFSMTGD